MSSIRPKKKLLSCGCYSYNFSRDRCKMHATIEDSKARIEKQIEQEKIEEMKHKANPKPIKTTKVRKGTFIMPNDSVEDLTEVFEVFSENAPQVGNVIEDNRGVSESVANLTQDLDQALSLYIRHKAANRDGMVKCFCCPKVIPVKEAHNSHYIKRGNRATRFLEANCRVSCPECNQDHNYDETVYTNALELETPGITSFLRELAKGTYKATRSELKELLLEYRIKLDLLNKRYETIKTGRN